MNLLKRIAICFYIIILCIPTTLHANELPQKINAKGAILIEKNSGRVLWEKDSNLQMPMASTTKIMTCIYALEKGSKGDIVTASKRASLAPKVKMGLKPGEKQSLEDLLYALMLQSSNDAAVAIAEHISGSEEEFCKEMTQKAKEIGAKNTVFKTANGLDADGHVSTAYDLAIITKYAYENLDFIEMINTQSRNIPTTEIEGSRNHTLINKNRFLTSYQGANGVKTGYTGLAGHCFVGSAKRDNMDLIAVVLASGWGKVGQSQKYVDTIRLMDYGFENYKYVPVIEHLKQIGSINVKKGKEDAISLAYGDSLYLPLKENEKEKINLFMDIPSNVTAPIKDLEVLGYCKVFIEDELVGNIPVVATKFVEQRDIRFSLEKVLRTFGEMITN